MSDSTTSTSAVVMDVDGTQPSPPVSVPSQVMSDGISSLSSLGTNQPRRGFSFRPRPLPVTPVQFSGKPRVVEQSSYQTNRALDDLQDQLQQRSLNGSDDVAQLQLRISDLNADISAMQQRLDQTVENGLEDHVRKEIKDIEEKACLVVAETSQKETEYGKQLVDLHHDIDAAIQREFNIHMEDKVTNVRIDVDVEHRDLEKQIQDLTDTQKNLVEQRLQEQLVVFDRELEKKQHDLGKEANDAHETHVEAHRSQHEEKKKALSADIQVAWARQGAASASQMEAYDHVSKQLAAIKEDHSLTMKSMTEDALATL
ncbi:uncharacterized protein ARMOST_18705 [Armillaria ostoyae]|uniref:Uncharacterized protein n=1 Tax=Armillaria ostoyae TaxID=47428 RepID=A0A284S2L5_ARMOS|nr:uncharacterized protein ARMOST_18705 [Armillaria ostoyae]